MTQKKSTGLSKKIPAIFQGLPDIDTAEKAASSSTETPAGPRGVSAADSLKDTRILFEVGESSAKMLIARDEPAKFKILKSAKHYFDADSKGKFPRHSEALRLWLEDCVREHPEILQGETRVLLSGQGTYMTELESPAVRRKELRDALIFQIADKSPFPVEEAAMIFEEKNGRIRVGLVENALMDFVLAAFHAAGIHPAWILMLPTAYQSLNEAFAILPEKNVLLADMGRSQTSILAFRKGEFCGMRQISVAGENVTRAMMGTLIVGENQIVIQYEEARTLKETLGLPTPDLMSDANEPKLSQLAARIRPLFEKMTNEFRASMIQFQKQFPEEKIEEVILSGGEAQLKGVDLFFSQQLNLPVKILDLSAVDPSLDLSLAPLGGLVRARKTVFNFAAVEDIWRPRLETMSRGLRRAALAVSGLMAFFILLFGFQAARAGWTLKSQQAKYREMSPAVRKMEELEDVVQKIKDRRSLLEKSIGGRPHFGGVLRELSHLVPPAMTLRKVLFQADPNPSVDFEGILQAGSSSSPDLLLSQFLDALNQSPFFSHSVLESRSTPQDAQNSSVQFVIRTQIVAAP